MRRIVGAIVIAAGVLAVAAGHGTTPAAATDKAAPSDGEDAAADDSAILYLDSSEWRRAAPGRKLSLSAAFMRIFCTDQRMPASALVACLDRDAGPGAVFEQAMACAGEIAGR
jgi:hypothetical protein